LVNVTDDDLFPRIADTPVGASGTVGAGTKSFDALDGMLVPMSLVAVTVHRYASPFVKPDTTIGLPAPDAEPDTPPFDDVHEAVKPVIASPPSFAGPVKDTDARRLRAVAVPIVGASGTVGTAIRPIEPFPELVNHRAPSAPAVMP
jgi:hypothetical protein